MNIRRFCEVHNIRADVKYGADEKSHERMGRDMTPWTVTLKMGRRRMTVPFFTGAMVTSEPTSHDVLNCLVSDADGYDNARSFEDWCDTYGYDTDSRKAEATFKQVEQQARKLRAFLADTYNDAMECERL